MAFRDWDLTTLIAPDDCLNCEAPQSNPLCSNCYALLEPIRAGCAFCRNPQVNPTATSCSWCCRLRFTPSAIRSGLFLRNETRSVFHLAKFQGYTPLFNVLVERALGRFLELPFLDFDGLAYVPTSFLKDLKRPVNPAYAVATALHRKTSLPVFHLLKHRLHRQGQIGLDYDQRRRNAKNRFAAVRRRTWPVAVILVDDVLTTGATLTACSQQLMRAGVQRIAWFSLLRAE